jgi:membrane associated rhomboid family serine protease
MIVLLENISVDQANEFGLVLTSSGIPHHIKRGEGGWELLVDERDHQNALADIQQYIEENPDCLKQNGVQSRQHQNQRTLTGLWIAFALLGCHVAASIFNETQTLFSEYGSSASHILRGEVYRSVTSLTLHMNAVHLAGNMLGIALFGSAVCSTAGSGIGWLMILASGILGNLLNALFYRAEHLSVGASTAVFGAIGILCAHQFLRRISTSNKKTKAWVPLGGGLALLAMLGAGHRADLTAHLFGFVAGIVLGILNTVFIKRMASWPYQISCALLAFSIVIVAWMMPLVHW